MRVAVIGGGVVGLACAFALLDVADEVEVIEAGTRAGAGVGWAGGGRVRGRGAGGMVVGAPPGVATPLGAPGCLPAGLRAAVDPGAAVVVGPGLDPVWMWGLWCFIRERGRLNSRRSQ